MTALEITAKLKTFKNLIEEFGITNFKGKPVWDLRNEIFEDFKIGDFESKNERNNIWEHYQSLVLLLKDKQQQINVDNEDFSSEAESKIEKLNTELNGGIFTKEFDSQDIKELRKLTTEIFEFIKQSRWSTKDRKEKAWDKFNEYRGQLKKIEDEHYANKRKKYEERIVKSEDLRDQILATIEACRPDNPIEDLLILAAKVLSWLTPIGPLLAGFGFLYKAFEIGMGIKEEKPKNPLQIKSEAIRDIRKFIIENKDDLNKADKRAIFLALDEVKEELDEAWADYKEERIKKNEEFAERKRQYEEKQADWRKNQEDYLQNRESRLENQIAFKEKLESILENQRDYKIKLEDRLRNQQAFLEKQQDGLEDLEEQYDNARYDDFRDRVAGWIGDRKSKISEVENDIEIIEDKIDNIDKNIRDLIEKISVLDNDISELELKIAEVKRKLNNS